MIVTGKLAVMANILREWGETAYNLSQDSQCLG